MLSFQAELYLQVANISRRPHLSIFFDSSQTAKSDDKTDKSLNFADIKDNILVLEDENQFVKTGGSHQVTPSKEQCGHDASEELC